VNDVPGVLSALLVVSSILLLGTAAAFNMARGQLQTEEYGWPLLYSGRDIVGSAILVLGILMALVALSIPIFAIYRVWVVARYSSEFGAFLALAGSLCAFALAMALRTPFKTLVRRGLVDS
jgi:hypothetical protein